MNAATLLLIGDDPTLLGALRHAADGALPVLGLDADRVKTIDAETLLLDSTPLPPSAIAWVSLSSGFKLGDLYELTAQLQDAHVPVAITTPTMEGTQAVGQPLDDGSVHLPVDTQAPLIAAVLGALSSQAATLATLGREAELLRAHQTGMADQIGRIDEELRMAVKIQREFLPKQLPNFETLEYEIVWRPAGYVSGDIYDIVRLDESHVGVFIADAVGHGVPAALMTIYIKQSLHTKEITPGQGRGYRLLEPAETLTRLNKALLDQDGGSMCFATAAYAVIDTNTGKMTLARAGHPIPMLLRSAGPTEPVDPEGPMLGVFDTDDFEQRTLVLNPGDRLLLYSDGFEMAYPDRENDTSAASERYLDAFEALRDGSPEQAVKRFLAHLDMQTGSLNQRDDLTLLCVAADAKADFAELAEPIGSVHATRAA